jgi:hypothetical protein
VSTVRNAQHALEISRTDGYTSDLVRFQSPEGTTRCLFYFLGWHGRHVTEYKH